MDSLTTSKLKLLITDIFNELWAEICRGDLDVVTLRLHFDERAQIHSLALHAGALQSV